MKAKRIKIYSFGRSCIKDGIIASDNLEDNIITLTESFLTIALECYKSIKLEDGQLIEEIIKVLLPNTEEEAKEEWDHGLELNGKVYFAWFATPGGMKSEKAMGKCETFFIREDFSSFATEFEALISLGKFKEIEASKIAICINKDVLSRLSLGVSNSIMAGDMPNIIVLPQHTFHIIKDYKTIEKFTEQVEDKKGKMKERVNYNLVDHHFDDDIDVFDGFVSDMFELFNTRIHRYEKERGEEIDERVRVRVEHEGDNRWRDDDGGVSNRQICCADTSRF